MDEKGDGSTSAFGWLGIGHGMVEALVLGLGLGLGWLPVPFASASALVLMVGGGSLFSVFVGLNVFQRLSLLPCLLGSRSKRISWLD
jgi:hypothetical protein